MSEILKINYLADLHIEHMVHQRGGISSEDLKLLGRIRNTESDVLVLAGDTYYKGRTIKFATDLANGRPVVVVAGNHEFYAGWTYRNDLDKLRRRAGRTENVHFLENESIEIQGVVFLGCTLWTNLWFFEEGPYRGLYRQDQVVSDLEAGLNDYRYIKWNSHRAMQPFDAMQMHATSLAWLRNQFEIHRGKKIVVVTHHAPSIRSVHEMYHQDVLTAAYASHLDELVENSGAALWIHGHTHDRVDYRIGQTRVVTNCRGYDAEMAELIGFDPQAVVQV